MISKTKECFDFGYVPCHQLSPEEDNDRQEEYCQPWPLHLPMKLIVSFIVFVPPKFFSRLFRMGGMSERFVMAGARHDWFNKG